MADKANNIIVTGATALYPRLNQTYKFIENNGKKERVSCDPSDDGAEYTLNLVLTKAQAVPLYKAMKNAYEAELEHSPLFLKGAHTHKVSIHR